MDRFSKFSRWIALMGRNRAYGIFGLITLTVMVATAVSPSFLAPANVNDLLVQAAPIVIMACGVMVVILTAEIDISVGSMMGILAATLGVLTSPRHLDWPVPLAALAIMGLGAGMGAVNGVLVAFGKVPSIIVTLGMLTAFKGGTEFILEGGWITDLPEGLRFLGTGSILSIPISVGVALVVVGFTGWLLSRTSFGRRVYAVGSNQTAALYAGIPVRWVKLLTFTWSGFLVGVAVLVSAPQLSVIDSGFGTGYELLVVTCVVVGGVAISGGVGTVAGVVMATLLMTMISTVLIFLKLGENATYWSRSIQGCFILGAVLLDHWLRSQKRGWGRGES